jgi:hypothetical protein
MGSMGVAAPPAGESHTMAVFQDKAKLMVAAVKSEDTQVGWHSRCAPGAE